MSNSSDPRAADRLRPARRRSSLPLFAVLAVCAAPVAIAALIYFSGWRPGGNTNYGELVEPQRPVPEAQALALETLDGQPFDLRSLYGKWVLLTVDTGACADDCAKKLFIMRQTHASTGKEIGRIERIWLVSDQEPVPTVVIRAYDGMRILRARPEQLAAFLAQQAGESSDAATLARHIWLIDPRNNLMLRFPHDPDPQRLRKDIGKLLHASRIG